MYSLYKYDLTKIYKWYDMKKKVSKFTWVPNLDEQNSII